MADSFEDEAIDDVANRPLLATQETSTGPGFRGCTINRRALSALHTTGFPTRLFGVALSCPFPNADERTPPV
jgi:hypothetical protein